MTKKHCEKFLQKSSLKYLETKLKKSGIRVTGQRAMSLGCFSLQIKCFFFSFSLFHSLKRFFFVLEMAFPNSSVFLQMTKNKRIFCVDQNNYHWYFCPAFKLVFTALQNLQAKPFICQVLAGSCCQCLCRSAWCVRKYVVFFKSANSPERASICEKCDNIKWRVRRGNCSHICRCFKSGVWRRQM